MRWKSGRRSDNIEDRRSVRTRRGPGGMRVPRLRVGRKSAGGGLGAVILILAALYFGIDPRIVLEGLDPGGVDVAPRPPSAQENTLADFVSVVLADTEDSWRAIFAQGQQPYQEPRLVLFTGQVASACGFAQAAMGPFYCPGDHKIYIDLAFYEELRSRFGAPGDFAQAYVIAHEVGHHVQNLLGISDQVRQAQRGASGVEANELSVRLELQADCLAGVWASHADRARGILESGDVEEALAAAAAIGDDHLQRKTTGRVLPDSFTHGTSEQRVRWFRRGMEGEGLEDCDTFGVRQL